MRFRTLCIAAMAGAATALAACGGSPPPPEPPPPEPALPPAVALLSQQYIGYLLERDGEAPIAEIRAETVSCPDEGCTVQDPRTLSGSPGSGTRDGFDTATGTGDVAPFSETVSEVVLTVANATFTRYAFWAEHGFAAVEIGSGDLAVELDGTTWSGTLSTAQAWTGGEAAGTDPAGTGSATWRGIAEAAGTATFERLQGSAEVRIADLSQPLVDVDIDLGDGAGGTALRWAGMPLRDGRFAAGTAGADHLEGRFHGPRHQEAWGVFDTRAWIGAFGARRQ